MPNCLTASVLFRAYVRRKPSGLLLVTVLSAALPRPVFRSYPLDIGEAAAVERSVGHALESLHKRAQEKREQRDKSSFNAVFAAPDETAKNDAHDGNRQSHALLPTVNVVVAESLHRTLPCGPEDEHSYADKREEQHAAEGHGEFKQLGHRDEVEHGSPPIEPAESCTVCIYETHNRTCTVHPCGFQIAPDAECNEHGDAEQRVNFTSHSSPHGLHQPCEHAAVSSEEQAGAEGYAVKQHLLTLRVVWQGLL